QTIWQSLASELDTENSSMSLLAPWLRRAVADKDATAYVLANHMVTNKNALASIARLTYPDAIPNEYGDDPWVTAANSWKGAVSDTDAIYLACYLLARALGTASRNTASLVELSFSKVYKEAASNRIEPDAWRLIDSRLPRPYSWQEWNRCQQLCYGIAQVYVRRGLPPSSFAKLGNSDADFAEIAGAAAKEWHGKSYLREVRQFLNENGGRKSSPRMRDIDRLLDSWLSW
ncbi:MAG: hypothetical protein Q8L65_01270, partial [Burkholderiales bacterium]|nr:hypothetical protein [Burkholderiales bacterium]